MAFCAGPSPAGLPIPGGTPPSAPLAGPQVTCSSSTLAGTAVRSLRTELLLLGIQDFELISLAREAAQADPTIAEALDRAFAKVIRAGLAAFAETAEAEPETLYSLAQADYETARREVIEALLAK